MEHHSRRTNPRGGRAYGHLDRPCPRGAPGAAARRPPRHRRLRARPDLGLRLRCPEHLAASRSISRHDQDRYALMSSTRAEHARDSGLFEQEIVLVLEPDGPPAA
ncbi:hypothetical protein JHN63_05995 [Streptomyces sp. MBT65]|nr:hypothetical protein [Streptomyces sp. MBT65]